ncbi:MAG: hypothetical protein U0350_50385 [Caldilineaceae bacterium]
MAGNSDFQLFNLATMSGIFPGARTKTFQRLRLQALDDQQKQFIWAQVYWYTAPVACVVYAQQQTNPTVGLTPLVRLTEPFVGEFNQRLQAALQQCGWQMVSCGSCAFWQPLPNANEDGLPTGRCIWTGAPNLESILPANLATQANLALSCPRWQRTAGRQKQVQTPNAQPTLAPMRKAAEISESKLSYWARLCRQLARLGKPPVKPQSWEEKLVERSGVGAGTEPCFACQGRIANLGALAVETPEGDKQTFSVWRCRSCYTTYLNDWIDRWERLDNLETEEKYYRIAPAEALDLLTIIDTVTDGDHPGRRRERQRERLQILDYLAGRSPLSSQIKQGR